MMLASGNQLSELSILRSFLGEVNCQNTESPEDTWEVTDMVLKRVSFLFKDVAFLW